MKIFDFKIDKDVSFIYWAQYMLDWIWYNKDNNKKYYLNIIGRNLDREEKNALQKLSEILNKSDKHGYFWLWNRYSKNKFANVEEQNKFENIKNVLNQAFEKIWEVEFSKLVKWKDKLSGFEFTGEMVDVLKRTENFFNVNLKYPIEVKLVVSPSEKSAIGAAKKGFEFIIFGISNLDDNSFTSAINTLFHETAHLIENRSTKNELIKAEFEKNISLFHRHDNGLSWGYLFREGVIYSIVGRNFSYLIRKARKSFYMDMSDKDELEKFSYKENKTNYAFQSKTIAYHIRDFTAEYLDNWKEMDKIYAKKLIEIWSRYLNLFG